MPTSLYSVFSSVAIEHSTQTALIDRFGALTYQESLSAIEALVPLIQSMDRSAVVIIGPKDRYSVLWQLACAQADQVFVPCDEHLPSQRLACLMRQIQPQLIIDGTGASFEKLGFCSKQIVPGGVLWRSPLYQSYPENVSHLILSSGSTGLPKAILLPADPVISVVQQQAAVAGIHPGSQVAWLLSPSFDASLSDIYSTLLSGATLHICPFSMRNIKTMRHYFNEHAISHTDLSPSLLSLLNPLHFPSLHCVIFGGEIANESCVKSWFGSGKHMINAYGPTETTICSHLREVSSSWHANIIGFPLQGVHCLLASNGEVQNPLAGYSGELWIGGPHLAVGYDSKLLNESRFVFHQGIRYFRSGDAVSIDNNGEFVFTGRLDRQCKIRGTLLCPEEIEALALSFGCREAVLRCENDHLTLDYVPCSKHLTEALLRSHLRANLPATLVPQRYIRHDSLEKSISGKIIPK